MNPADFIALAVKLSNSQEEADLRTAVSRAYYGAFHSARQLLEECGIGFPRRTLERRKCSTLFNALVTDACALQIDRGQAGQAVEQRDGAVGHLRVVEIEEEQ